jgi:hypothetical protein
MYNPRTNPISSLDNPFYKRLVFLFDNYFATGRPFIGQRALILDFHRFEFLFQNFNHYSTLYATNFGTSLEQNGLSMEALSRFFLAGFDAA